MFLWIKQFYNDVPIKNNLIMFCGMIMFLIVEVAM